MARTIEEVASFRRVEVEENSRNYDDFFLQAGLKEVKPVTDLVRQPTKVQPDVESTVWDMLLLECEANLLETSDDEVAFRQEVLLECLHFSQNLGRFEHRDSSFLEGNIRATVKVRATAADGLDELFWSDDPGNTPSRESETLRKTLGHWSEPYRSAVFRLASLTSIKRTSSSSTS